MKKKTITLVVYMLVCISLVSVGFAAWIITGGQKEEVKGNIKATSVSDQSVSIKELQWVNDTITFGHPTETGTGWLQHDEDAETQEQLSAVCTFKVESSVNLSTAVAALASTTLDVETVNTAEDVIYLQENGYISSTAQIHYYVSADDDARDSVASNIESTSWVEYDAADLEQAAEDFQTALQKDSTVAYVAVKVTYSWGAKFGNVNPFRYFNEKYPEGNAKAGQYIRKPLDDPDDIAGTDNWKQIANDYLTTLYNKLGQASGSEEVFILNIKLLGEGEE